MDNSRMPAGLKMLAAHLSSLAGGEESILPMEMDMLSLVVSEILRGADVARQYPTFYQKLLENASLRQAFLDALEAIEAEQAGEMIPMPGAAQTPLRFLERTSPAPAVQSLSEDHWRITLQRTLEQLQTIFSPPELSYRADAAAIEDPWFTLLREEMKAGDVHYTVALDCTLSAEADEALATYLNLAITLEGAEQTPPFPLQVSLQWGDYSNNMLVTEEGRFRFADIPLASVFDPAASLPESGLSLTLETTH